MFPFLARRRLLQVAAGGLCLGVPGKEAKAAAPSDWSLYKQRYVSSDGRVVDSGNGMQSHSEGQGYGMLFAQAFDDQDVFDRMFAWTERTLKRQGDALHAWHYLPNVTPHVPDTNNATDGDLLIALALVLAGRRWGRPELEASARDIYAALRKRVVVTVGRRAVLLPGLDGFAWPDHALVNASYYIMPSLMAATELDDRSVWQNVIRDGMDLIRRGRFGRWNLPPDWMQVSPGIDMPAIARGRPARFSYDAVRVPLYLQWAGLLDPGLRADFQRYWNGWGGTMPAWVNLQTGERSPYDAPPGFYAVGIGAGLLDMPGTRSMAFPSMAQSPDYYSASLTLLASLVMDGLASDIVQRDGGMF
ncbi:glycosyl hydrolase family 8 [Nguyenibacter sp. L1]|uniref:glycosyl hydrolase family 8 n=1 Tax=Nguyenibacter sp. L1 TaxID=3049350 RepID=UPI002B47BD0E|nr:glycosyl hydrolase family 8 [Nguyenibacter sp. L1]WRH88489.1 glycosyl hydrolase family 8 [Nguyenibacter sp. L1]